MTTSMKSYRTNAGALIEQLSYFSNNNYTNPVAYQGLPADPVLSPPARLGDRAVRASVSPDLRD